MEELKQFVPSLVCLTCPVCCRFENSKSHWRPRTGEEERLALSSIYPRPLGGIPPIEPDGYLEAKTEAQGCRCVFFSFNDQTCALYFNRPFECRLYPFLLTQDGGRKKVAAHLACPFALRHLNLPVMKKYIDYLKEYFQTPDVQNFLAVNPALFGDYSENREQLEFIFDLPNG